MKKLKQVTRILLSLMIVVGLMPLSVFAIDTTGDVQAAADHNQIGNYYRLASETSDKPEGTLESEPSLGNEQTTMRSYENGFVEINKTINKTDQENVFDINLEVKTKAEISDVEVDQDAAAVLVIDTSGSMKEKLGNKYDSKTRLYHAKEAAQKFINSFAVEGATRKIAIVTFANSAYEKVTWVDASALKTEGDAICDALSGLYADGGTNMEDGFQKASGLLNSPAISDIANKNVILLSDGVPTYYNNGGNGRDTEHNCHANVETLMKQAPLNQVNKYAVYIGQEDDKIVCTNREWVWHRWGSGWRPSCLNTTITAWLDSMDFAWFATDEADKLIEAFEKINDLIELQAKAWKVDDPMGQNIKLIANSFSRNDGVTSTGNGFTWNLRAVKPTETVNNDESKTYTYSLSYKIELDTLSDTFVPEKYYATNGVTTLSYLFKKDNEADDVTKLKYAYFNVPSVKGYAGDLTFTKVDENGESLEGAQFTLKADDNPNFTISASSGADGNVSFANIPSGHTYTLEETEVPTGYRKAGDKVVTIAFGETTSNIGDENTIVNEAEKVNVKFTKIWNHGDNQERPTSIKVQLYRSYGDVKDQKVGDVVELAAPKQEVTTPDDQETPDKSNESGDPTTGGGTTTDESGAIDENGTTDENSTAGENGTTGEDGTTDEDGTTGEGGNIDENGTVGENGNIDEIVITGEDDNTSDMTMMSLSTENDVNTIDEDGSDENGNGDPQPIDPQPQAVEEWSYVWADEFPAYINGQKVTYSVKEVDLPEGYLATEYEMTENSGVVSITITNTYRPATLNYKVTKEWVDNNNQDGKRPESIQVQLSGSNDYNEIVTLNEANGWEYEWTLPAYSDDKRTQPITYTAEEISDIDGYTKSSTSTSNSAKFTNTHVPETIAEIKVNKVWSGDSQGTRHDAITVKLLANGSEYGTLTLGENDTWEGAWNDLPKYQDGTKIVYTVKEVEVKGYESSVVPHDDGSFTIINTLKTTTVPDPDIPYVPWNPTNPTDPTEPDEPTIEDPDVPLAPGPDEDVDIEDPETPLAPAPDEPDVEIDEDDVPLSDAPKTGDEAPIAGLMGMLILSAGAMGTMYAKRKDEE